MQTHLHGIMPPMVTPFRADESIDEDALRADVRYLIGQAGVDGLTVTGSTGEGHTLTDAEVRRVTEVVLEEARGEVPVISGVICDSTRGALQRAAALEGLDVAALQVTPVHYLFRPGDDAMETHFATLARESGRKIIIYNVVPWTYLSPDLLCRIMRNVPDVIGVKQSAGDMKLLADLLLQAPEGKVILTAVDALLYPSFALGAQGAVAAILTAAPTLCTALWRAMAEGDHARGLELHKSLLPIWNAICDDNLPANVRCAMALQGREGGQPRAPMVLPGEAQQQRIKDALASAGLV